MTEDSIAARLALSAKEAQIIFYEASSVADAVHYAVTVCKEKDQCTSLLPETTDKAESLQEAPQSAPQEEKVLAAPGLPAEWLDVLRPACAENGISLVTENLRRYIAGLDVGFSIASAGIAATATAVLDCTDEDVRLASMLCEDHVILLPRSALRESSYDVERQTARLLRDEQRFISFISGPSRTADIERVLTIGVHGPLAVHLLLLHE